MGVGIFSDCVFFLKVNSLPFKEKAHLKTCITTNGGVISLVANDKCTHVVVASNAALNSSQQKTIQKHGIAVVRPDFIWRSIQENGLVEVALPDSRRLEVKLEKVKDDKRSQFLAKFMKHSKTDIAERDSIDDEEFEDEGDEKDLPTDIQVAKYSFFKKGDETAIVELLCLSEQCSFPFKVSTVRGIPGTSQKEFTFNLVDSSEKACDKYEQRRKDLENKGFKETNKITPEAELLASQALQKVLLGEALNVAQLSLEVAELVEAIWTETQVHLKSSLSCPVENISLHDVSKAEAILQNVRKALNKNENTEELMQEFYQCIPHSLLKKTLKNIDKKFLSAKQDLCQVIRDTINISETNLSKTLPSSVGKYRALKCRIDYVDPNTEEFHQVKKEILDNNHSNEEFQILRVFRVGRLTEAIHFRSDLGNVKSLFHATSPSNIVGILSRGLLLPKIIVDEFGVERTDIGNLGSGIYFSDSISTSVKYTQPFIICGKRVLLVCDVALGNTKDVGERDFSITESPEGFHSLHGVRKDVWTDSQFIDDEYVVYNIDQVKMRYIVQFCNTTDIRNLRSEPAVNLLEENEQITACEPTEDDPVEDLPEAKEVKGGLQGTNGQQIPLESIHVKARLKDLAAQVVIFQTYKNNSLFPIEAKYVFPLDSTAAVCGFEAFINGKHIVGKVKEKQQARREYRTAISQGHGAYLMDQDSPDVFTVSVGNLPARATVIIKITYVTELESSYGASFSIPGSVASWQEDQALKENTQDTVAKVGIEGDKAAQGNFSLDMSVEMPRKIEGLWSFTHSIKSKKTECKAVIQVEEGSSLTELGFSLHIDLEAAYIPRMWVETHPDQDSEACMLIFQPQFEDSYEELKITICLDCSNSMESCFQNAKRVALLAIDALYYNAVNIIVFGSTFKEFNPYPKGMTDRSELERFIKTAKPNMGSTEFWKPLQSICLLRNSSGHHKILLISDGQLQNENLVFQILKKNKDHIKLFTCGVGAKSNKHMLRCLAKNGSGAFEFFADKSKSSWRKQMEQQDRRLRSAICTAVSVKWRLFGTNPDEPLQAPANIQSLFVNENLFVYGFVPHCTQATLKALINDKEFEHIVSTTELQKTTGTILHKLTARAFIRDYEDGILHEKEHENEMEKQKMKSFIIKLSKEHSIVTQFTSFVAVEKRSATENENIEPNIHEIIAAEDVDILPYMDFKAEGAQSRSMSEKEEEAEEFLELEDTAPCFCDDETNYDSPISPDPPLLRSKFLKTSTMSAFSMPLSGMDQCFGSSLAKTAKRIPHTWGVFGTPSSPTSDMISGISGGFLEQPESLDLPRTSQQEFGFVSNTATLQAGPQFSSLPAFGASALPSVQSMDVLEEHSLPFQQRGLALSSYSSLRSPCVQPSLLGPSAIIGQSHADLPGNVMPGFGLTTSTDVLQAQRPQYNYFTSNEIRPPFSFGTPPAAPPQPRLGDSPQVRLFDLEAKEDSQSPVSDQPLPLGAQKVFGFGLPSARQAERPPSSSFGSNEQTSLFGTPPAFPSPVGGSLQFGLFAQEKGSRSALDSHSASAFQLKSSTIGEDAAVALPQAMPPPAKPVPHIRLKAFHKRSAKSEVAASLASFDESVREDEMTQRRSWRIETAAVVPPPPPLPGSVCEVSHSVPTVHHKKKKKLLQNAEKQKRSQLADLSWSSFSRLQCQEGYWMLTSLLGKLLNIHVKYFCDNFLTEKGISSLGQRGKEEVLQLIATLLVLQTIRSYNLVSGITFKTLMKLDQCDTASESYPAIEKAVKWAVKTDRQYSGICSRMGLGRDWEHATLQLLGLESPSSNLSLVLY